MLLYGPISSQQSWWEDRVTPAQFNKELAALGDVPEIVVRINSGGGDVFAANAIFTRLKDHTAKITVKIDGWAASAATIIAMAGDTIKIARNGVFMIHDPAMTVWDTFKAEDFKKMADELEVIKQSIVNTYSMKTGKSADDIAALMSEEKWWTGDEAVTNGFCDELMFEEASTVVENASKIVVNSTPIDISAFKTVPKVLLNSPHNPTIIKTKYIWWIFEPGERSLEATFGASLLLTLPISSLTINIFGMVVFYSSQGMRFYVDSENVITTKKMEETDAFSKLKFIV